MSRMVSENCGFSAECVFTVVQNLNFRGFSIRTFIVLKGFENFFDKLEKK